MFERALAAIEREVEGFEIPVDRAALIDSIGLFDRFEARILEGIGAFDQAEGWREDGATSMTAWLRTSAERSGRDAGRWAKTAKRLSQLPVLAAAYRDGRLSSGQLQAIAANISDKTVELFAETEHELVPTLAGLSVTDVSTAMQAWAQAARDALQPDPADDPEPPMPERSLHLSRSLDGRREISGSLDPESGALAETALRIARTDDVEGEPTRTPAEKRADALTDILRYFLDHQNTTPTGARHRPHLNVFLDEDDLLHATNAHAAGPAGPGAAGNSATQPAPSDAPMETSNRAGSGSAAGRGAGGDGQQHRSRGGWLADGTRLDLTTIARLACDCGLHRILRDGKSSILDYGRAARTAPPPLFNALVARDRTCRFPGCDRPAHWTDAHHVDWWDNGGRTSIRNLVLLCSRHHHLIHTPGWRARLLIDATFEVIRPDGQTYRSRPPGKPPDLFQPAA